MEIRFSSDIVEVAEQQLKRGETDPVWMQEFMQPVGFVHSEEWYAICAGMLVLGLPAPQ